MSEVKVNKISPRTNCGTVTVGDSGDSVSVTAGVPVTVNGDLKSNALKATDGGVIISQSGTNITIGASGDTVSLASGASQSGFGRAGSVNWQTGSIKTSNFTAVSGEGYFCNTTSGAFTATLPASPSAGDIVSLKDYAATFDSNNLTVGRNSSNIGGIAADLTLDTAQQSITLVYVDGTKGWLATNDSTTDAVPTLYVTATGGTVATCGDFKIHKFTGPGTFCVSCAGNSAGSNTVDYMVVAGGGGGAGGGNYQFPRGSGAGGGGGVRLSATTYTNSGPSAPRSACVSALPVPATAYPITVGGGGAGGVGGPGAGDGGTGGNSVFSTITSAGGAKGAGHCHTYQGQDGGSGGSGANASTAGDGNVPPVSPPQGMPGGNGGASSGNFAGGGGGGFMAAGAIGNPGGSAGAGGAGGGYPSAMGTDGQPSGGQYYVSGGGGGGMGYNGPGGSGGLGGGSAGTGGTPAGAANYYGGGGGGAGSGPGGATKTGGAGSGGLVIIRYKFQN